MGRSSIMCQSKAWFFIRLKGYQETVYFRSVLNFSIQIRSYVIRPSLRNWCRIPPVAWQIGGQYNVDTQDESTQRDTQCVQTTGADECFLVPDLESEPRLVLMSAPFSDPLHYSSPGRSLVLCSWPWKSQK